MSIYISEKLEMRMPKVYVSYAATNVIAMTIPITTVSPDQIPLNGNTTLLVKWKLNIIDPSTSGMVYTEGGCGVYAGSPPTLKLAGFTPLAIQYTFTGGSNVFPAINGSGDLEITIGPGFSGPNQAEGYFEITDLEILSVR